MRRIACGVKIACAVQWKNDLVKRAKLSAGWMGGSQVTEV